MPTATFSRTVKGRIDVPVTALSAADLIAALSVGASNATASEIGSTNV
jgi:hypothetical protein